LKCVEACSQQKSAQDECDADEDTAVDPPTKRLRSEQNTGRAEKPDAQSNRHKIREPRGVSHSERESHSHRTRKQCKQGIGHVMRLCRDPGECKHQSRQKSRAIRSGHRTHYCSPRDDRIPVRHTAENTSITEGTAILRNGGEGVRRR
jgi:hypothetical protein